MLQLKNASNVHSLLGFSSHCAKIVANNNTTKERFANKLDTTKSASSTHLFSFYFASFARNYGSRAHVGRKLEIGRERER